MELRSIDLPSPLLERYEAEGITGLYPPQAAAVEAGVLGGRSIVAAIPTASGKTLIGEFAMLASIDRGGRALYVVPLRALAAEKHERFNRLPGVDVGIATGDMDATVDDLAGNDIVVATSEKVDSLIRHDARWIDDVGCVVLDEVHLLDSADRGPTLEITVAKLRRLLDDIQFVALSATIANPDAVAEWLDAALVESSWRPVELRRGVARSGRITFANGRTSRYAEDAGGDTAALVRDTLVDGGQCLVFVHSRRAAEVLATEIAEIAIGEGASIAGTIRERATTGTGRALAGVVEDGVAFHHAGLRPDHRSLVEGAFRDRLIDVVCATPTLAAGVNLPARRVIVRDTHRFTDSGREPLSVLEVHQMFGRAGRPGLDPVGEGLLVADDERDHRELVDRYLEGEPAAIESKLASQAALRSHALAAIAGGFAAARAELIDLLESTFYATHSEASPLVDVVDLVLDDLDGEALIRRTDGLEATALGRAVSRLYVEPRTAVELLAAVRTAATLDQPTRLTYLEIVCSTDEVPSFYLRDRDWASVYRFVERHESALVRSLDGFEGDFDAWLSSVKTVRVLADWLDGADEETVTDEYGIGPGDLRLAGERADWLAHAAAELAEIEALGGVDALRALHRRIANRRAESA